MKGISYTNKTAVIKVLTKKALKQESLKVDSFAG
jgi:hypothetical protein